MKYEIKQVIYAKHNTEQKQSTLYSCFFQMQQFQQFVKLRLTSDLQPGINYLTKIQHLLNVYPISLTKNS